MYNGPSTWPHQVTNEYRGDHVIPVPLPWYEHIILVVEHNGGREVSLHGILNLLLEGALLALVAVRPPDQSHPVDVLNIRLDIRRGLDGSAGSQRLRDHKEADKALVRKA